MIEFEPKYITFDCYGTLIRFRMADMTRELYGKELDSARLESLVSAFAGYRRDEVLGAWKPYRDVVVNAFRRACKRVGVPFDAAKAESIYLAVPTWGPHPDVPEGLSRLATKYKLVILSNVDNESFAHSNARLQVEFDAIITAEDIGSYKPSPRNFEYMLEKLGERGIRKEKILHTAESLFHDHKPANGFGLASCWIYRRHSQPGFGATMDPGVQPKIDFRFNSMADLVEAHQNSL